MKRKINFRMPTAYSILFLIIIIMAGLTWIVPAGQYDTKTVGEYQLPIAGTYHTIESTPQGFIDILQAPISGFIDAITVSFFIMIVGGFVGVTMKTGALDAGIAGITRALKGKEKLMIFVLITAFALGGTTYGMAEETIPFYPLVLLVILAAGYDTITGASIILLGAGIGVLASTVNPFATGIASSFADAPLGDGLFLRLAMLVVGIIITYLFIIRYAEKVKADPSKSIVASTMVADRNHFLGDKTEYPPLTGRRKIVLVLFAFTFSFMVFSLIPFDQIGAPAIPTLGWYFEELSVFFMVMGLLIGIFYRLSETELVESFISGMADLLGVGIVIGISRGITIIMNEGNMTATILNLGETTLAELGQIPFVLITYLFYIPMSFLVPSSSGLATLSMPVMAPMADFVGIGRDMVITAYQSASGIVNFVTPTSAVVMGALAISRISYEKWIKFVWKYIVIIFIYTIVFLLIGVLV